MAKEPRVRAKGFTGQREKGWWIVFDLALPELIVRLQVRNELQVFLRSYELQHPCESAMSQRVRQIVRNDYEAFYAGGQFPGYVFATYRNEFPAQLLAAE